MSLSTNERELLLQTFLAEAREHLRTLEGGLVTLEDRPDDAETLNEIFRIAHSLKGDAALVGFPRIAELAHVLEDVLEGVRDGTRAVSADLVTLLLRAVDVLRALLHSAAPGDEHLPEDFTPLRDALAAAAADTSEALAGPAAARARSDAEPAREQESRTLRIDVGKLDRMLNLTGEIAISRGRIARMLEELPGAAGREILEAHREADRLQLELQEQVMKSRLVPVGPFFRQYARTVRDLAHAHGKSVELVVEGDDVEVDTRVVERLRDPITHMIRNTVDHGLESPELRVALGKPAEGRLTLRAGREGGWIVIQVSDDGAGFNRARITERARDMGLSAAPELLPDGELLGLVFAPGFSTAETVTDMSGRGVGMDVVRRNIEGLRGTMAIESVDGVGATITIRLPLTLAIIEGFGVRLGDETYVLPLDAVRECLALPTDTIEDGTGLGVMELRGSPLPFIRLGDRFGRSGPAPARQHVVVVHHQGADAGLVVDDLLGEGQAVVKSLGRNLGDLPGVSGSTILGSGRVALILDVPQLLAMAHARPDVTIPN